MKKTTKLLSVLLALVMLMSCFTMATYAAKAVYQTGANLNSLGAYSPDGAATRFTTEERMSILFDWLDTVLYNVDFEGVHNTTVVNIDITINSVDEICASVSSLKSALSNTLVQIAGGIGLLGDLKNLTLSSWPSSTPTRAGTAQLTIIQEILQILVNNASFIDGILEKGSLNPGSIIGGMLDVSPINKILKNIPKFALSKLYPLMSRKDDTKSVAENYFNGEGAPSSTLNTFVNGLFNKPQSTTTYKENASGTCISGHTLPTSANNLRYYYVKTAASGSTPAYFTCFVYDPQSKAYKAEDAKFYREEEGAGTGIYTYKTPAGDGLKYYKTGSYWLPSFVGQSINVNNQSVADIFYKFIPYVFDDLAPIALNGFVKQALATWMGATETKIYEGYAADASSALATLPAAVQTFFQKTVPYYQFSYSDYLAYSDDVQYYRYVDKETNVEEWFEIDMTTGNYFLSLFDLSYTVEAGFMNEFVPSSGTSTKTLLQSLNDFLCKAARTVLKTSAYNSLGLQTGDNAYLVSNLRKVMQQLLPESPEAILGPDYLLHYDGYYQTLVNTSASNQEVLSALAAIIAKALMPQLILPSAAQLAGQDVGAVLACVVRELVTQFVPTYNYDALIFANGDYVSRNLISGKHNSYWLDVILTMGLDVGMSYLSNLTDLGADKTNGFTFAANKTYSLSTFESNPQAWEATVDWIIDWALLSDEEWEWNMAKIVDVSGLTLNLSSAQDPWTKLDKILNDLLPLKQIINCTAASGQTWLETVLRDKLILGLVDLNFEYIVGKGSNYTTSGNAGLLSIPSTSVLRTSGTNQGALSQLLIVVRDLVNKILYKLMGSTNLFDTSVFKIASGTAAIDTLNSQTNIRKPIKTLLQKIETAHNNGLWVVLLPILEMFVGWKTGSQEYVDPVVKWSGDFLHGTDALTLTITNSSAGMLLKNYKADGTSTYEQAYNIIIDSVTGSGITATRDSSTSATVAPYGRVIYSVKANSAPSSDTAVQIIIKYRVTGKAGAVLGGQRTLITYKAMSNNWSDVIGENQKNDFNASSGGTNSVDYLVQDFECTTNGLCLSGEGLENYLANNIWFKAVNKSSDYDFTINNDSTFSWSPTQAAYLQASSEVNSFKGATVSAGSELVCHPAMINTSKTYEDFVSGQKYGIGKIKYKATSNGCTNGPGDYYDLGYLYFADAGELQKIYDEEIKANRVSTDYNTSSVYNAYVTAMKNACTLLEAPAMQSNFATVYAKTRIDNLTAALETAVENVEADKKEAVAYTTILENGLATGETAALLGADDQINFQDFKLYGYWLYEKNRTEARDILKEYEAPTAPESYIDGCWLPYTDNSGKNEDLTHVIAAATAANATKGAAITGSLKAPDAKDVAAYNTALSEYKTPEYTELYVTDIAQKLDYYNDYLIPRAYSKVAAGRVQLAQELSYAAAQSYNANDYTDVSWARYQKALTAANAANTDGTMQSYVFQAKYDLLVAQRQLRLKAHDYATQVGFDGLQPLIDLAEGMFANSAYFDAVDGTLDTEWTDLIVALGYTAEFGTGTDAWSMNLYEKSATQLTGEELYYPSVRNDQRVEDATDALQAAIDALECTIKVVKNDATTNVDQDYKFITNLTPGTIISEAAVRTHVTVSNNAATLAITGALGGTYFGTGTLVAATLNSIPIANYYIVIYGDVNGDNVIDGFDAVKADRKLATGASLGIAQNIAADATKDGSFDVADVSAIIADAAGNSTINQA